MTYRQELAQLFSGDPNADAILEHFDRRAAKIPPQGSGRYWSSWGPERMALEEIVDRFAPAVVRSARLQARLDELEARSKTGRN